MSTTRITVELTICVDVGSVWADGCTIGQLKKQAKEDAAQKVNKAMKSIGAEIVKVGAVSVHAKEF